MVKTLATQPLGGQRHEQPATRGIGGARLEYYFPGGITASRLRGLPLVQGVELAPRFRANPIPRIDSKSFPPVRGTCGGALLHAGVAALSQSEFFATAHDPWQDEPRDDGSKSLESSSVLHGHNHGGAFVSNPGIPFTFAGKDHE